MTRDVSSHRRNVVASDMVDIIYFISFAVCGLHATGEEGKLGNEEDYRGGHETLCLFREQCDLKMKVK